MNCNALNSQIANTKSELAGKQTEIEEQNREMELLKQEYTSNKQKIEEEYASNKQKIEEAIKRIAKETK